MTENDVCAVCSERKVMKGSSIAAEKARKLQLCSRCRVEPGVARKRAEDLGIPMRAAGGSRPKWKKRKKKPAAGRMRVLFEVVEEITAEVESLSSGVDELAGALGATTDNAERILEKLKKAVGDFGSRREKVVERLHDAEDRLSQSVKGLGDQIPLEAKGGY